MDERVRGTTARRVRQIIRSAAEDKVIPLRLDAPHPPRHPSKSRLRVLLATSLLALLPMGSSMPTLSEPVDAVALYHPDLKCGMSKFRMVECDTNEYVVQGLIGGHPPRSPGLEQSEPLPVF